MSADGSIGGGFGEPDLVEPVAAEAEDAAATIIRLDAFVSARFGGDDIAPMQSVLLRSESAASSQIENLTVGAKQLAIAELGGAASKNAELVSRNVRAMDAAIRLSDNPDAELTAFRAGDLARIVERVCDASLRAAGYGRWLVDSLAEVQDSGPRTSRPGPARPDADC